MNFFKFKRALQKSWGSDTAYPKVANLWTKEEPYIGQCTITALLFNEFFGGKIYGADTDVGVGHFWNTKLGIKIDLTKKQFEHKPKFSNIVLWDREDLLKTGNVLERYTILRDRFLKFYREM